MAVPEYWKRRHLEALRNSANTSSAQLRDVYLTVAEHCRSLEQLSARVPSRSSRRCGW